MKKLLLSLILLAAGFAQARHVPLANLATGPQVICPKNTEVCYRAQSPIKAVRVNNNAPSEHMIFKKQSEKPNYQTCPAGTEICIQSNTAIRTLQPSQVHVNNGGTCRPPAECIVG